MPEGTHLTERWLTIAALGEESVRNRRSMTPLRFLLQVTVAQAAIVTLPQGLLLQ